MLSDISVKCFVFSYVIALLIELTRPFFRVPSRMVIGLGFTLAGLVAHVAYITVSAREQLAQRGAGLLAGWYEWALLLALGLAVAYVILVLLRPSSTLGYFMLPVVLALIAMAWFVRDTEPFGRVEAAGFWRTIHGIAMLLVTVSVLLGFISGALFLTQANRLKHKRLASEGLRLPSLEWLQSMNRWCLATSTTLMAIGLLSGIAMQLNQNGTVSLTEGGVLFAFILFAWLLAASAFELFFKSVSRGRKIAYLTLASFGFLVLAVVGVVTGGHAMDAPNGQPQATSAASSISDDDASASEARSQ